MVGLGRRPRKCDSSLAGKAPPCQGGDRGFESRLSLFLLSRKSDVYQDLRDSFVTVRIAMDIKSIRQAISDNEPIEYTAHCQKRMLERDITRADIINCIFNGEIIEDYPLEEGNSSDNSFPCCLILGWKEKEHAAIHIVVGYNGKKILMISACYPDSTRWNSDYRTRRI